MLLLKVLFKVQWREYRFFANLPQTLSVIIKICLTKVVYHAVVYKHNSERLFYLSQEVTSELKETHFESVEEVNEKRQTF